MGEAEDQSRRMPTFSFAAAFHAVRKADAKCHTYAPRAESKAEGRVFANSDAKTDMQAPVGSRRPWMTVMTSRRGV